MGLIMRAGKVKILMKVDWPPSSINKPHHHPPSFLATQDLLRAMCDWEGKEGKRRRSLSTTNEGRSPFEGSVWP
ncbi:hypothetical protein ACLOJK_014532 [Asimina triloba]